MREKWSRQVQINITLMHEIEIGLDDIEKYVFDSIFTFDEPYANTTIL